MHTKWEEAQHEDRVNFVSVMLERFSLEEIANKMNWDDDYVKALKSEIDSKKDKCGGNLMLEEIKYEADLKYIRGLFNYGLSVEKIAKDFELDEAYVRKIKAEIDSKRGQIES